MKSPHRTRSIDFYTWITHRSLKGQEREEAAELRPPEETPMSFLEETKI